MCFCHWPLTTNASYMTIWTRHICAICNDSVTWHGKVARWAYFTMRCASPDASFAVVVRLSFEPFIWPFSLWHASRSKNTSSLLAPTTSSCTARLATTTSKTSANLCQWILRYFFLSIARTVRLATRSLLLHLTRCTAVLPSRLLIFGEAVAWCFPPYEHQFVHKTSSPHVRTI